MPKCETCGKETRLYAWNESDNQAGLYHCEHGDHIARYP